MESFENAEFYFRQAKDFDHWWQAVSTAADRMGFGNLILLLTNRDGTPRKLTWQHDGWSPDSGDELLKVSVPVT